MKLYSSFEPAVSIILPTYNRANLIERAVISILNQTFSNWELIIVDDGSTDNTFEVINNFLNDHQNIRYLKHSNRKLPLSLNAGITASAGEFISFLGSDDEYSEDYLSARVNYMKDNSDTDLIHGGVKIIGDPFVPDKNDPKKSIHINECIVGGTFFGRRNIFFELNGFNNLDYSEDSEFFERAAKKYVIRKVDLPAYIYYRDTENSITNSRK
jgi:glycosyltransferase involved in cell wall biosynthesis